MIQKFTIVLFCLFLIAFFLLPTAFAQTCPTQSINPRVKDGLISASEIISDKFGNASGICAVDPSKISFAPYKIPGYDDLNSIFFVQSKLPPTQKITLTGNQTQSSIDLSNTPRAPTVTSSKSCLTTSPYSNSELAISWTDALITQVKISDGTNTWTKNVSGSSTTGPFGFTSVATGAFYATVGTTYSFSVSNGTYGPAFNFGISACPLPDDPIVTTSPACIYNADTYSGSEVTIPWTSPYVTRVDISTDQGFPAGYWSKTVTTSPADATNFTGSFNLGTTYYVRLYDGRYNLTPSTFNIPHCPAPAAPAVAVDPACLNTSTYSGSEITISWTDPNVTQAKITGGAGPWTELNATFPLSAPSGFGTATSFVTNTSYTASLYNGDWGNLSQPFSMPTCPAPLAPTGLAYSCSIVNTTTSNATLTWAASQNATSYNVQTDGTSGGSPPYSCNSNKDETCQTVTPTSYSRTVTRNRSYGWRVQGSNLSGNGSWTSTTEPWSNTFTCP